MNMHWRDVPWLKKVKYEEIGLDQAKKLLTTGLDYDRKPNMASARQFLESMRTAGAWWPYAPSQVPIIISTEGKRLNGQTRLIAYVQYLLEGGEPFEFPVLTGVPMEVFEYIDIGGRPRTANNAIYQREGVTRDAARVNWLHALLIGDTLYTSSVATLRNKFEVIYADEVEWAANIFPGSGKNQRAPYIVPFMYVYMSDKLFATKLALGWKSGEPLPKTLHTLRDAALGANGLKKSPKIPPKNTNMVGGGRKYTHEGPTFKILNILAELHKGKHPSKASDSSAGFKYWSELRGDGAWEAYENQSGVEKTALDSALALTEDNED